MTMTNPILTEIRQTRDELAKESGYNLKRLFEVARARERESAARGVKFVSSTGLGAATESCVLREEPPKP